MNRSITKAIASVAVCGAGLAGSLVLVPPATSAAPDAPRAERPSSKISDLGYKATVYGTKVLIDGVEVRNLKDAFAQQRCTRRVGLEEVASSVLAIPDNPLIRGGLTKSYTQTYKSDGVEGVRGISTIADLELGGEVGGQQTPTLKLVGLKSTADAFRKADGTFGHAEDFTFEGLTIGNLPDTPITPQLQQLLDILGSTAGDVVNQVIDLLSSVVGNTIEIPGLGSIGLAGVKSGYATKTGAASQSYALRLLINATGNDTMLTLGRARSAVSSPVPAGVFQSRAMGLEMFGGNDLLRLGGLQEQSIGCSGTNGKTQVHKVGDVRVLGGLVNLTGLEYALRGDQKAKGSASGLVSSKIGALEIPSLGLVIDGITSKVSLFKPKHTTKVKRTIDTSLARITLNGQEIDLPDPGEVIDLGGNNLLRYRVVKQNWTGAEVKALVLTLPDLIPGGSILELGWAGAHISPN